MNRKGYTLLEMLVAMFCIAISLLLLTGILKPLLSIQKASYLSEDILGIRQLRLLLAQSYHVQVEEDKLTFRYHGEEARLLLHNHRLVRQGGYVIYLKDLDAIRFDQKGNQIYLYWRRENDEKNALLTYRE